jgi:glycosyltransferase involved in cell wall biosynthesis
MGHSLKSFRILVVAPTPFFADRGCHVRILGEVKALGQLGHHTKICTYHLGKDIDGVSTVRTLTIPWYRKLSAGPSVHKFYIDLLLLWKTLRTCWSFRPNVIHAHLHEGIVIGKLASLLYRVPMVADLQGSLTEEILDHKFIPSWSWLVALVRTIEKVVNRMPHHLIASSTRTAQLVIERFGIRKEAVAAIGDGVDLQIFYPREPDPALRGSLGISPQEKVVVFIGVLSRYQGIDLLLEQIPRITAAAPDTKFLIIGFPEEGYREKAKALGVDSVAIFTGKIPYAEAPPYLALGTVAVSPKVSTTEANLKLFNYMAMGLPTVVFDNPVNREILQDLGVYAENGNSMAFADAVIGILKDPRKAKDLGEACYKKAYTEYSWESVGQKLLHLYRDLA